MNFNKLQLTIAILILSNYWASAQKEETPTPQAIVSDAISAMGGKEYLQSITTLYTDIETEMEGRQVHWIVKEMLPNKGSFQILYNKRIVYHNWYDGEKGYEISGGKKVEADPEEFKDKKYKKNIFNELDYLDTTLYKLAYMGEVKQAGEDCYKVSATLVNGLVNMIYFSKKNHHIIRADKIANKEKDSFSTVTYSGFKKFGQLTFYTEMKMGEGDHTTKAKLVELLTNQSVTNDDFK